jgi:hypothetical protein
MQLRRYTGSLDRDYLPFSGAVPAKHRYNTPNRPNIFIFVSPISTSNLDTTSAVK